MAGAKGLNPLKASPRISEFNKKHPWTKGLHKKSPAGWEVERNIKKEV